MYFFVFYQIEISRMHYYYYCVTSNLIRAQNLLEIVLGFGENFFFVPISDKKKVKYNSKNPYIR